MKNLGAILLLALGAMACTVKFDVGPAAGGTDSGVQDASVADAGGADAGVTSCVGVSADFCADFEEGAVDDHWTEPRATRGGTLAIDPDLGFGSARSARFQLPGGSSSDMDAALDKRIDGPWRPMSIDFDTWLATPNWGGSPNLAIAHVALVSDSAETAARTAYFALFVEPNGVSVSAQTPTLETFSDRSTFPYDRWVHVGFDVDFDARTVKVRIDGRELITARFSPSLNVGGDFHTRVTIGLLGFNPPAPAVVQHVDNVVVRRR